MITRHSISRLPARSAVFLALAMFACTYIAGAQVNWSPPCGTMTINNNDPVCPATITFTTSTGINLGPFTVPPGASITVPTPPVLKLTGIISNGGFAYPFNGPPTPPGWTCLPNDWWIGNVTLGTGPGACCYDICLCMVMCQIFLNPTTAPPPCNP